MSVLEISIRDRKTQFSPGEIISGEIAWQLPKPASALELRLFWFTEGKGTSDVSVEQTQRIETPAPAGRQEFRFQLLHAPYSFAGTLIELSWALELVAIPGAEAERADFVLAPSGHAIQLQSEDESDSESKVRGWVEEKLGRKKPSSLQSKNPFDTTT